MEVVTAGALPSLLPKLADLLIGEYNLQREVKGGIKFLQAELETMKAALEEISETPADKLTKLDKIWARDVRELSYDIDDKIDAFMVRCKGQDSRLADQNGLRKIISRSHNLLMQPNIRRKIATDIRDIKSRVVEVHERRRRYDVNNNHGLHNKPVKVDPRALVRYEDVTNLVGIDETREEFIKILMQDNSQKVVSEQQDKIVSIVGFGGLGKTTLANAVYENLRKQFDCSAFVPVSRTPDMDKLFNNLLYQLAKRNNACTTDNAIYELREFLGSKRYFIVIDDIWDISHWEAIRCALPRSNGGCKIVITTRIQEVAEKVGGAYQMKPLRRHNSRILLYRRIYGHDGKDKCPNEELEEVSDKILTKCAGVPLAITTVASLLASKGRSKLDWYEVYNSIGTGMENNTKMDSMRKILSVSYYDLPSNNLRACFLYLTVFPEDYEIDRRRLIRMWIAEGFIQCSQEGKGFIQCGRQGQSPFEVGESYFNELINRSLIQPVYDYDDMGIRSCRVHDMVLDLIHSLSSEENFITTLLNDVGNTYQPQKAVVRRLSLQNGKVDHCDTHGATASMEQVRSAVVFSSAASLIPALSRFKVVRVLHLENCDLSHGYKLKDIGKLVHLRCLGLPSTRIVELPEEIGNLQGLQTLDISNNEVPNLPFTIGRLRQQLKCLYVGGMYYMRSSLTLSGIRHLTSLEELSLLGIRKSIGTVQELGHLTELRILDISYRFRIREPHHALVECLNKLQKIQDLSIYFYERSGTLNGWTGPSSLRNLKVTGCDFLQLPAWFNPSHLQNLSLLVISVAELQPEDLEILGRFPALRYLNLWLDERCSSDVAAREFVICAGSFPCLLRCKLQGHYERVVFQQGAMPSLTSLDLDVYRRVWCAWEPTGIPDLGFENLTSLLDLRVGLRKGRRDSSVKEVRAALRNMAEIHPNRPSISALDHRY